MLRTLTETLLIVIVVIFLFLGSFRSVLIPIVAIPISLVGAVFLMLVAGFTINLLTLLAIVLSVGLVVDDAIVMVENVERHLHEGKPPHRAAIDAARELVGPIIAMTITLAAVYAPVGIQGGLTGALFREFAFTLAGAVIVSGVVALTLSPMMGARLLRAGDTERGFAGWINRRFDSVRRGYTRALAATLRYRPVVLDAVGDRRAADGAVLHVLAARAGAGRGPGRSSSASSRRRRTPRSIRRSCSRSRSTTSTVVSRERQHLPDHVSQRRLRRHGDQAVERADQDDAAALMESMGPLSKIPGVRVIPQTPPPLPGGGDFPVDLVIASAAEPQQLSELAEQLVQKAFASGLFIFADADLKFDQPQAEVVFDRDKLRSQGVDLSQAGRDLSTLLGGNYVNRFSIQGRSYKVIPQVEARRAADARSARRRSTSPDRDDKLVPLSTFASLRTTAEPRELKKFQQLNAVRIQGVIPPPVPLDQALRFLENEARKILPQGFTIDYAGESRQLRTEGSKFLGTFLLSAILIYLVLAAQFESFRDPFIILAGSVPLARVRRAAVLVPRLDDAQHLQPGRADHAGRPGVEERHPDRAVRQPPAGNGQGQARRGHRGRRHAAAADPDDDRGDRRRSFPLVLATGPGAGARNSIGIMLVSGMIIGTLFTLFVVPSIYMLVARTRVAVRRRRDARETPEFPSWRRLYEYAQYLNTAALAGRSDRASACSLMATTAARRRTGTPDDASADARRRGSARGREQSGSGDRPARHGGRGRARGREPRAPSRRCSRRCSAARATSRRRRTSCWAIAASTSTTVFSSTGVRQRLPWGAGTWSVSWDTVADDDQQSAQQLRSEPAVGHSGRVLAAAAEGPQDRRRAPAVHRSRSEIRRAPSSASASRSSRPSRPSSRRTGRSRRRSRTSPCSSARSSSRRSSRGRTGSASMPGRSRRSIWSRRKPRSRSGART